MGGTGAPRGPCRRPLNRCRRHIGEGNWTSRAGSGLALPGRRGIRRLVGGGYLTKYGVLLRSLDAPNPERKPGQVRTRDALPGSQSAGASSPVSSCSDVVRPGSHMATSGGRFASLAAARPGCTARQWRQAGHRANRASSRCPSGFDASAGAGTRCSGWRASSTPPVRGGPRLRLQALARQRRNRAVPRSLRMGRPGRCGELCALAVAGAGPGQRAGVHRLSGAVRVRRDGVVARPGALTEQVSAGTEPEWWRVATTDRSDLP